MKIKTIKYQKCFNLGNYENEVIGAEAEVEILEDPDDAFLELKEWVARQSGVQLEIIDCCKNKKEEIIIGPPFYHMDKAPKDKKILVFYGDENESLIAKYNDYYKSFCHSTKKSNILIQITDPLGWTPLPNFGNFQDLPF